MSYVAKHRIDAGEARVFEPGADVPDKFVDEAMVEAGSVEKKGSGSADDRGPCDALSRKEMFALCAAREIEASPRAKVDELRALLESDDAGDTIDDGDDFDDEGDE